MFTVKFISYNIFITRANQDLLHWPLAILSDIYGRSNTTHCKRVDRLTITVQLRCGRSQAFRTFQNLFGVRMRHCITYYVAVVRLGSVQNFAANVQIA